MRGSQDQLRDGDAQPAAWTGQAGQASVRGGRGGIHGDVDQALGRPRVRNEHRQHVSGLRGGWSTDEGYPAFPGLSVRRYSLHHRGHI